MCYIHCKNELLRDLLFVLLVSSGKIAVFSSAKNILKAIRVIRGDSYGRFP